jgi:capsular exopolysaccharide synthesis family protein
MELAEYINIVRRWLWLILLAAFVTGSAAFIIRSNQPRIYEASTKIIVGNITTTPDPDSGQIRAAFDLTRTYSEIVNTFDVLNATINALDLPVSEGELRRAITTSTIPNTSLLTITVRYGDPILVADIANEVARQLILQSPSNLTPQQEAQVEISQEQIDALVIELQSLRQRLSTIDVQIASADNQEVITDLNSTRSTITDQINQATSNIAMFTNTIANIQQRTNTLHIVELAQIPIQWIGSSTVNVTLLGAMVGAALAFGMVLLLEYLNDTFRTGDEVVQIMRLPVLGVVSVLGKSDGYKDKLITNNLFSKSLEEYRGLCINLMHNFQEHETKVFVVTSPAPADGKTLTAANLALSIALSEKRVLLIDADLRRPKLHEVFDLHNRTGLTTYLTLPPEKQNSNSPTPRWKVGVHYPGIVNLRIMTRGFAPSNPTELLGSSAMKHWMDQLKSSGEFDVVIFDTSPCLAVADPVVLASTIQADVLLVLSANRVKRNLAVKARDRFTSVGTNIVGVLLNYAKQSDESYYNYYEYYYAEPSEESKEVLETKTQ